jgi:streptomycin 6-kinase
MTADGQEDRIRRFAAGRRRLSAGGRRGEEVSVWLNRLPVIAAEILACWSLTPEQAGFARLSYNYVVPVVRADGAPAVLKLSFPGDKEFRTEAAALGVFYGRGVVRLLDLDLERGAMLLERCVPGEPLPSAPGDAARDGEAVASAAGVLRRMWRPAPPDGGFPLVSDWARGLDRLRRRYGGETGPMPAHLVEEAERLFAWLVPTQAEPVLLHGDFHHDNVLSARREDWLAIDPKGVVGEPAYDAATLLREPPGLTEAPGAERALRNRLDRLSGELDLERDRLLGWATAQAVLAAYWGLEDGGRVWEEALDFARLLAGIRA